MACKQFGLVLSLGDLSGVSFKRSPQTDRLRPQRELRLGQNTVVLKWLYNYHHSDESLPIFPASLLDQKSPQHILNVLNDHCLRAIFLKLSRFDQCAAAQVCQRFRYVAVNYIKPNHISLDYKDCIPIWKLDRFFRIFGPAIQSAYLAPQCPEIAVAFLARHCENLTEFNGMAYNDDTMAEMVTIFPQLQRLKLLHSDAADRVFQPNAQIESISVEYMTHLPVIHYPKLRDLEIKTSPCIGSSEQAFFALNPQIERLVLGSLYKFSLPKVLVHLPNLREFKVSNLDLIEDTVTAFGQLKHLHTLQLSGSPGDITQLLQAFLNNGVHLKHLTFVLGDALHDCDITLLTQMNCLEYLNIDFLNSSQLERLFGNSANLTEIECFSTKLTPEDIRVALRHATQLEKATFRIRLNLRFSRILADQSKEFDAIAELRKSLMIDVQIRFEARNQSESSYMVSIQIWH